MRRLLFALLSLSALGLVACKKGESQAPVTVSILSVETPAEVDNGMPEMVGRQSWRPKAGQKFVLVKALLSFRKCGESAAGKGAEPPALPSALAGGSGMQAVRSHDLVLVLADGKRVTPVGGSSGPGYCVGCDQMNAVPCAGDAGVTMELHNIYDLPSGTDVKGAKVDFQGATASLEH